MIEKLKIKINESSISYLVLCVTGLVIFIFAGIVPNQRQMYHLEREIDDLRFEIEQQRVLRPIYTAFRANAKEPPGSVLVVPAKAPLERDRIGDAPAMIRQIALKSGLSPIAAAADFRMLTNRSPLRIDVTLRGDLFSFRNFLTELGALPSLEGIEEIQIQATANGLDYRLKVWLALN